MWCADNWKDYELLDASDGERLERWGKYILVRPDPRSFGRTLQEAIFGIRQTASTVALIRVAVLG